jgi:hypothetical protein
VLLQDINPSIEGVKADASHWVPLFQSVIQKAGGDPITFRRSIQKLIVSFDCQLNRHLEMILVSGKS